MVFKGRMLVYPINENLIILQGKGFKDFLRI
jgi:hypothetical protein